MAKEITKVDDPITKNDPQGGILVTLPWGIREDREVLRWLSHWVVDAMADHRYINWMADDVEERLGQLGANIIGTTVADLVRRAREATSKPKKSQPPKKAKKGKRK